MDCSTCKKWKEIEEGIKKIGTQYPTPEDVALYRTTMTGKVSMLEPTSRWHIEKSLTKEDIERTFGETALILAKRKQKYN